MRDTLRTRLADIAVEVGGTEAIVFHVDSGGADLRTLLHLRPDSSSATVREEAQAAFREIVSVCLTSGKDGAIQVSDEHDRTPPQFCLVMVISDFYGPTGIVAIVTRCRDEAEATQKLEIARKLAAH
jgi:hypothetical protein